MGAAKKHVVRWGQVAVRDGKVVLVGDGGTVAIWTTAGEWIDPHGGKFDAANLERFATDSEIIAATFRVWNAEAKDVAAEFPDHDVAWSDEVAEVAFNEGVTPRDFAESLLLDDAEPENVEGALTVAAEALDLLEDVEKFCPPAEQDRIRALLSRAGRRQ